MSFFYDLFSIAGAKKYFGFNLSFKFVHFRFHIFSLLLFWFCPVSLFHLLLFPSEEERAANSKTSGHFINRDFHLTTSFFLHFCLFSSLIGNGIFWESFNPMLIMAGTWWIHSVFHTLEVQLLQDNEKKLWHKNILLSGCWRYLWNLFFYLY